MLQQYKRLHGRSADGEVTDVGAEHELSHAVPPHAAFATLNNFYYEEFRDNLVDMPFKINAVINNSLKTNSPMEFRLRNWFEIIW